MDPRWTLLLVFGLAACQQKTPEKVFPESAQKPQSICQTQMLPTEFIVQWEDGRRTLEKAENAEHFKEKFLGSRLDSIRHVEFNKRIHSFRAHSNSDFQTQDMLASDPLIPHIREEQWGVSRIEAAAVWSQGFQGQGVRVAVVDSLVDRKHPQLETRVVAGYDFFGNSNSWTIAKGNDHGTHVAGIIAADSSKGPLTGVAPQALIVAANFMDQEGAGNLADAVRAIDYSVQNGARVINASWGGPCPSSTLELSLKDLESRGVLFITASGNSGEDLDQTPSFPAAYAVPAQITVAATGVSDLMTGWSNSSFRLVNLGAPGVDILSTTPNNTFKFLSGTSMATPMVAGAAALLISAFPKASPADIKQALLQSVDIREYRVGTRGRLNVRQALELLKAKSIP
ncbi:MAG: S8 family peptidase [Bdellovibrio sp.]